MASQFFMTVTGKKQGEFKGETGRDPHYIPILGFSFGVSSPRDAATGQASGKRQYKPITIFKEWGAVSVQLFEALVTNEELTSVVIEEMRTDRSGREVVYMRIHLTTAFASDIEVDPQQVDDPPVWTNNETERISFVFQKIEITDYFNNKTAQDDWEARV